MIKYILYLLDISLTIYIVGRLWPRAWIKFDKFPFTPYKFEKDGVIYEKIKIKKWKNIYPDASKITSKLCKKIPKKSIKPNERQKLKVLLYESCVAEITHIFAIVLAKLYTIKVRSAQVIILSHVYALVNIPAIIIQRYNRPRIYKLYNKCKGV